MKEVNVFQCCCTFSNFHVNLRFLSSIKQQFPIRLNDSQRLGTIMRLKKWNKKWTGDIRYTIVIIKPYWPTKYQTTLLNITWRKVAGIPTYLEKVDFYSYINILLQFSKITDLNMKIKQYLATIINNKINANKVFSEKIRLFTVNILSPMYWILLTMLLTKYLS